MNTFKKSLKTWLSDESGQGTLEYGLVVFVIVAVVFAFRGPLLKMVGKLTGGLDGKIGEFLGS